MGMSGAVCAAAGTGLLICFLLPVFTGRILNIGNVTGLVISTCLLFYGLRQAPVHEALGRIRTEGPLPARIALAAAGILCAGIALTALLLTCMMVRAALKEPAEDANVIVLGCEVKGEKPSLMLSGRIYAAVHYLQRHPGALCVVSGGTGEGEKISEAECMYRSMTAQGIEPARILLEDRSVSTRENLLFSMRKLEEAGAGDNRRIAVVTNEFHACRAHLIAKKLGLQAGSVVSRTPWWLFPTFYVRELYGLLYQLLL